MMGRRGAAGPAAADPYSHAEWLMAKHRRFNQAENARLESERLVAESNRLLDDTNRVTQEVLEDVNKRLEQRIQDVDYWRSEVNRRQVNLRKEIDTLGTYPGRLQRSIEQLEHALDMCNQCRTLRAQRQGIDLVHDVIQENLLKEADILKTMINIEKRAVEQAKEQLRLNRKAKFALENDLFDKTLALKLDNFSVNLRPYSAQLLAEDGTSMEPYAPPSHRLPAEYELLQAYLHPSEKQLSHVSMQDWRDLTNANIAGAEGELNNSIQLRGVLDGILAGVMSDFRHQVRTSEEAFADRVRETRATKMKLEEEHAELDRQVSAMELNIFELRKAYAELEKPLVLAQTRLSVRANRPNVELCDDLPHKRLQAEVEQLARSRDDLRRTFEDSERALNRLLRNKLEVEEDIKIKSQSLYLDEVQCGSLRKTIVIQPF